MRWLMGSALILRESLSAAAMLSVVSITTTLRWVTTENRWLNAQPVAE